MSPNLQNNLSHPLAIGVPVQQLDQYVGRRTRADQFGGLWSMLPDSAKALEAWAAEIDLKQHLLHPMQFDQHEPRRGSMPYMMAAGGMQAEHGLYELAGNGIAVIEIMGVMTKHGSSWSSCPGSSMLKAAVRRARSDNQVRGIMLLVDSPGGSTSGITDLAEEVRAASNDKPVHCYVEDTGASAAYMVGSQADRISCNRGAFVGSIGTYMTVADYSAAVEASGIKVHVIRAGEFKGAGEKGTAITTEQLAEFQRTVDAFNSIFVQAVGASLVRRLGMDQQAAADRAAALNDGRVHIGTQAIDEQLVDAVETFEQALEHLDQAANDHNINAVRSPQQNRSSNMASTTARKPKPKASAAGSDPKWMDDEHDTDAMDDENTGTDDGADGTEDEEEDDAVEAADDTGTDDGADGTEDEEEDDAVEAAATFNELRAEFRGEQHADADFFMACQAGGMSLTAARKHYTTLLTAKLEARDDRITQLAANKSTARQPVGNNAAGRSTAAAGGWGDDPAAFFKAEQAKLMQSGMRKGEASQQVYRTHEGLREARIAQHNALHRHKFR